jgi:hypothetical protein
MMLLPAVELPVELAPGLAAPVDVRLLDQRSSKFPDDFEAVCLDAGAPRDGVRAGDGDIVEVGIKGAPIDGVE